MGGAATPSLKGFKKTRFCRGVGKALVVLMLFQGVPFQKLTQSYQWTYNPEPLQKAFHSLTDLFSPAGAQAATAPAVCDVDGNGGVNRDDISANFAAYRTVASPGDPASCCAGERPIRGVANSPQVAPCATIVAAPKIQTPSRAEHGREGGLFYWTRHVYIRMLTPFGAVVDKANQATPPLLPSVTWRHEVKRWM